MQDSHSKPVGSWEGKTFLLIPCKVRPEWIWVTRLTQLNLHMIDNVLTSDHYRIDTARNMLVETALEKGATTGIFLDSDVLPPIDAIERILAIKHPIVSGLYFVSMPGLPKEACAWGYDTQTINGEEVSAYFHVVPTQKGLMAVDAVGMGFCKIDMDVFRKIEPPWFEYMENYVDGKRVSGVSEDFYFCRKARDAGYKIALDTTLRCQHLRTGIIDQEGNYEVCNSDALKKA